VVMLVNEVEKVFVLDEVDVGLLGRWLRKANTTVVFVFTCGTWDDSMMALFIEPKAKAFPCTMVKESVGKVVV
ncbi:hypothetical protein KI387_038503, partial [Taxus chinensis]